MDSLRTPDTILASLDALNRASAPLKRCRKPLREPSQSRRQDHARTVRFGSLRSNRRCVRRRPNWPSADRMCNLVISSATNAAPIPAIPVKTRAVCCWGESIHCPAGRILQVRDGSLSQLN